MYKVLNKVFRCCGISPSGTWKDKYFVAVPLSITIYTVLWLVTSFNVSFDGFERSLMTLSLLMIVATTAVFIIRNWIEPKNYMSIMNELGSIDNELQHKIDGKQNQRMGWLFTAMFCLFQVTIFYDFNFFLITFITNIVISAPLLQQIIMVERMKGQFLAINNEMATIAVNTDTDTSRALLDFMFRLHSCLQALVVEIDLHFCSYNLFGYTSKFLHCVLLLFAYLKTIEADHNHLDYPLIMVFGRETMSFVIQALVCHACSAEANRTVLLAHRVLHPDTDLSLWEEVGLFSALAVDNRVHFTVGGIFILDRALITQTALTALSYLIIAVQLREVKLFGDISEVTTANI